MRRIFVDSSGWIALYNRRDANHERAAAAFASLKNSQIRLVTSDYIVDESLTHIRAWGRHADAVTFGNATRGHPLVEWVDIDADIWSSAWEIFVRYDDKRFSFTDCTSFAIMRAQTIREVFTFDADFQQMGFRLWPGGVVGE
jgi:predicted nucleic acid-binding protein